MKKLYNRFAAEGEAISISPLGDGLINDTYIVKTEGDAPDYVLQRLNTDIFTDPQTLERNITSVCKAVTADLVKRGESDIDRKHLTFIPSKETDGMFVTDEDEGYWRLSIYIPDSKTLKEVTPQTASIAGEAFGHFQSVAGSRPMYFGDPDLKIYKEAIPDFHNMKFRLKQLEDAVSLDPKGRLEGVRDIVNAIMARSEEMSLAEKLFEEGKLPKRICHCDTKVNNMLFDAKTGEVLCVIDLDTVMPSFITSDYGDFLRTGAATVAEDSPEFDKVDFNMDIFRAFTAGYLKSASDFLTPVERKLLPYGACLFPYMQCVRFLTDWLNGDIYYKITYPEHNLVRAKNQWKLFEKADSLKDEMISFINQA